MNQTLARTGLHGAFAAWITLAYAACVIEARGRLPSGSERAPGSDASLDGAGLVDGGASAPTADSGLPIADAAAPQDGNPVNLDGGPATHSDAAAATQDAETSAATDAASAHDAGASADGGCARCSGPGDWAAGDYPPALREQNYLELAGVPGQQGLTRGFKVHVPRGYKREQPAPVVFAIHGLGQNAVMFGVDGAHWPEKSDSEGFILVMPNGHQSSWNGGVCCGDAATLGLDDVALFRAILAEVAKHLNVDFTRVYATGLSNGAFMSYRLACEAADVFAAVAPAAGAVGSPQIPSVRAGNEDFTRCAPSAPVAVLATHGTADPLVNYAGMKPSLEIFAMAGGCQTATGPAVQPMSGGDTTCTTYQGCTAAVSITGCTVQNGGHCWFGDETCGTGSPIGALVVGANSNTLVNTEAAWQFLKNFRRP